MDRHGSTSKSHSNPPEFLTLSAQRLTFPFVVAIIGASRKIGAATAKAFVQVSVTGFILNAITEPSILQRTKKEVEAAASFPNLKVTVLGADLGDSSSARLVRLQLNPPMAVSIC